MKKLAIALLLIFGFNIGALSESSSSIIDALEQHGIKQPWEAQIATDNQIINVMRTLFVNEIRKKERAVFQEVLEGIDCLLANPTPENKETLKEIEALFNDSRLRLKDEQS